MNVAFDKAFKHFQGFLSLGKLIWLVKKGSFFVQTVVGKCFRGT